MAFPNWDTVSYVCGGLVLKAPHSRSFSLSVDTDRTAAKGGSASIHDPFFRLPERGDQWNACIGRQGNEENYIDGYIEAAIELASAIIDKELMAQRDTLIMPILYNARHAIELILKYVLHRLKSIGIVSQQFQVNHDIMAHWTLLVSSELGDKELRQTIRALEPFVASLTRIDEDGQELRYPENMQGAKSLSGYSLANVKVIQESKERGREVPSCS